MNFSSVFLRSKMRVLCLMICMAVPLATSKPFHVYWNIPTFTCRDNFNISFSNLNKDYGITMNYGDHFRGDKISLLYNPGLFPMINNYTHNSFNIKKDLKKLHFVNGGIPQQCNFLTHLDEFENVINRLVPDVNNDGLIVIDMEEWGATWPQNFNQMEIYRIISRLRVEKNYANLSKEKIEDIATAEYEKAALSILVKTLQFGRYLRPKAKWGYYQYPQCFNRPGQDDCSKAAKEENDQMKHMYKNSGALYPSLYLSLESTVKNRSAQIRGAVREAKRVGVYINKSIAIYPYIWTNYFNRGKILDADLENLIRIPKEEGADGVIVWGSSHDLDTVNECKNFKEYVRKTFGPMTKKYISFK